MASITVNKEGCKGCALCVNACPKKVIEISIESNKAGYFVAYPAHPELCIGCAVCAMMCPDVCIEVER